MKSLISFLSPALASALSLGVALGQSPPRAKTHAEMSGQLWLTNYYGKTLSSLGDIVALKVESKALASTSTTNRTHTALWRIIEHSKIQDYASMGVAVGLPPVFSLEYAHGLRVRGSHYTAIITLPDGRESPIVLAEESPKNSTAPTGVVPPTRTEDALALRVAKQELQTRGQMLHDRLDYQVVEKDRGWLVTVGNLSGRQPKGHAYLPGDAVLIRIAKDGKVTEYTHVP